MTARAVAAAIIAMSALFSAPVRAQPSPDPAARAQAASHVRQGQAYFQRGDFDRALGEYQQALDLSAEPSLVFNIALCHDRADRPEAALKAYQRYLELAPNGSVADEARGDIARLTPLVERIVADRNAEAARRAQDEATRTEAARREEAARRAEEATAGRRRLARYVMIAGLGLAVGGGVAHALAWRTRDRLDHAPDADSWFADRDRFVLERGIAIGGYAAGAAVLATGLVLAYTGRGDGAQLSAGLTPGGATMVVAWSL